MHTFSPKLFIDTSAIIHNYRAICDYRPNSILVPVIKSEAYGHGAVAVAKALISAGAQRLAVFNIDEATALRKAGISAQLWLLEGVLPEKSSIEQAIQLGDARFALWNVEQLLAMEQMAATANKTMTCHLKIDTGMSRLGFFPEQIGYVLELLKQCPHIELVGAFSHLAMADQPNSDITRRQITAFRNALNMLPPTCSELHLCASDAILNHIAEDLPFARPGLLIYGYGNNPGSGLCLRPAMKFSANIISVKEVPTETTVSYGAIHKLERSSRLAVIPIGYADGYTRGLSNKACVLIHGQRCPIRGRICMGMMMADITDISDEVNIGDEAVLLGRQGNEEISAEELASIINSIPYEILCCLGGSKAIIH